MTAAKVRGAQRRPPGQARQVDNAEIATCGDCDDNAVRTMFVKRLPETAVTSAERIRRAQHDYIVRGSGFVPVLGSLGALVLRAFYPPRGSSYLEPRGAA